MVRINNISVTNFKNIASAKVAFKDFNVIVGPNGSGKSNFLRVLPFLNFITNGASDEVEEFMNDGLNSDYGFITPENLFSDKSIKTIFSLGFSDWESEDIYEYQLELCKRPATSDADLFAMSIYKESFTYKKKSKKGAATTLFARVNNNIKYNDEIKKLSVIDEVSNSTSVLRIFNLVLKKMPDSIKRGIEFFNTLVQSDILYLSNHAIKEYTPIEKYSQNRLISFKFKDQIMNLSKDKRWKSYKAVLKDVASIDDVVIDKIKSKEGKSYSPIFFTQYGKPGQLLSDLSDGTILMIAVVTRVFSTDCTTVFIEEPENSIHPRSLQNLISFLKSISLEKQFVISTHSASLLNMVSPDEVIVCRLDEKGMSTISGVNNPKELRRKLNDGYVSFGDLIYSNLEEF